MAFLFWRSARRPDAEDETAAQLRDMERAGAQLAGLAHVCAGVLVVLFSLGSLISLSAEAFNTVLASWRAGALDVPAAISVAVSTLLVVAMDTAMLYAASVLRMLATRGASASEASIHRWVMVSAALLGACTYCYMSWLYDRPATLALWTITIARALAAPLYAVYLSMARPLPVAPRDIFAQAELAAGRGVLRDVTALANDPAASLDKKLRVFGAASVMPDRERSRLSELIAAVTESDAPAVSLPALLAPGMATMADMPGMVPASYAPASLDVSGAGGDGPPLDGADGEPEPEPEPPNPSRPRRRRNVPHTAAPAGPVPAAQHKPVLVLTSARPRRMDSGRRSADAQARWLRETDAAADLLTTEPLMPTRELARRLEVRPERATAIRRAVQPKRPTPAEVAADIAAAELAETEGQATA